MVVVSSMRYSDIDLSKTQARGPTVLRSFPHGICGTGAGSVKHARRQRRRSRVDFRTAGVRGTHEPGAAAAPAGGSGGYKIDLAVVDPHRPGSYQLGTECDGAAIPFFRHGKRSGQAPQAVLEDLGWKICRIWSTDWIRNREDQIRSVFNALQSTSEPKRGDSDRDLLTSKRLVVPKVQTQDVPEYQFNDIEEVPDTTISSLMLAILPPLRHTRLGTVQGCLRTAGISAAWGIASKGDLRHA
ncbi:MAG: hypothetical protein U1D30_07610 [Planctomycetota bacterium]